MPRADANVQRTLRVQKIRDLAGFVKAAVSNPPNGGAPGADGPAYFCSMSMKRLSELGPKECGVIERVNTPEEVLSLVQVGCCIGSKVEVRHVSPSDGPAASAPAVAPGSEEEAAAHLWVRVAAEAIEVA